MNWFRVKSRWWETAMLVVAVVLLFRPDYFMDRLTPAYSLLPAKQVYEVIDGLPPGSRLALVIKGTTIEGEEITKTVAINLDAGASARERLTAAGVQLLPLGDQLQVGAVKFGSRALKAGLQQGWDVQGVQRPTDRPSPHWFYLPALVLAGLVWWAQGRRLPATRLAPA